MTSRLIAQMKADSSRAIAARQRSLHARITEAIERLSGERVTEHVDRLSHHALHAEMWEKAITYLRQAALRAMARAAYNVAVAHLEQALGALSRLPVTRETTELTIDILLDLRSALFPVVIGRAWGTAFTRRRRWPARSATSIGSRGSPPSRRFSASSRVTTTRPSD